MRKWEHGITIRERKPVEQTEASAIRSVSRALSLISLFTRDRQELALRELVELSGLPRTTVIRLVAALEDEGLLWAVGTNSYAVGPGLLRWADLAASAFRMPAEVREALVDLVSRVGETASIYIRDGERRVCIAFEECDQVLRHVAVLGREGPLWRGASGRVLLRDLEDDDLERMARRAPLEAGIDLADLKAWRASVADLGFSLTHNERRDGLSVAAVPLMNESGRAFAALSVAGPTGRVTSDRSDELRIALNQAKSVIDASPFARFGRLGGFVRH
ncbi:IclR family transcriptional regulator [Microbacterium sp. NPDC077663]|uniref:IclR family transcriptional regulator n=1 Tax=Microbacterium sp. NPDC077663 TaxID=3364189 RepID=UPI0037C574EA